MIILGGGGGGGGGVGVLALEGAALDSLPFSASSLAFVLFVPVTEALVGFALVSSTITASLPSMTDDKSIGRRLGQESTHNAAIEYCNPDKAPSPSW